MHYFRNVTIQLLDFLLFQVGRVGELSTLCDVSGIPQKFGLSHRFVLVDAVLKYELKTMTSIAD